MGGRSRVAGGNAPAAPQPAGARHGGVAATDRPMEGGSAAGRPNRVPDSAGLRSRPRRVLDRAVSAGVRHRGADHASCEHPGGTAGRGRAKTDRIDLDMLLRTLLAWLRGEPRVCSIVRIPSEAEEDMRRPERERERLVSERVALENRIENLLCLQGITGFKPRLKKAAVRLDELRMCRRHATAAIAAGRAEAADGASSPAQ